MKHIQLVIDDGSNFIKTAQIIDGEIVTDSFASRVTRGAISSGENFSEKTYKVDGEVLSISKGGASTLR